MGMTNGKDSAMGGLKVARFSNKSPVIVAFIVMVMLWATCSLSENFNYYIDSNNSEHMSVPSASAAINIGILQNQQLHASYSNGKLVLEITGAPLIGLGLLNMQQFVYQLPEPFTPILNHPNFKNATKIDFRATLLIGIPITDTILGKDLTVDSSLGTITGKRFSLLNLSLLSTLSIKLTIDLGELDMNTLPPSVDGKLTFYGLAAKDGLINLEVIMSQGATDILETDILDVIPPEPPIVHQVTDQDTVVTGTGEPQSIVSIITHDGSKYTGRVDNQGNFSVDILPQDAHSEITVTLTDAANNESDPTVVVVVGVTLELIVPELLIFNKTPICFNEITIPRESPSFEIVVRDTRGQGSRWQITAKTSEPLTAIDGSKLSEHSLIYKKGGEEQLLIDGVLIYEGVTGNEPNTTIHWRDDEGILLKLNPIEAKPEIEYATIIYWTLENAP